MEIKDDCHKHEVIMQYKKELLLSRINGFKIAILEMIKFELDKIDYRKCRTKEKGDDAKNVVHKELMEVYNAVNDQLSLKEKDLNTKVDDLVNDIFKDGDKQKNKLKSLLSSVSKSLHSLGNQVSSTVENYNEEEICSKLTEIEKSVLSTFANSKHVRLGPYITVDTDDFSKKLLSIQKFELKELGFYSARSLYENEKVIQSLTTSLLEGMEYLIPKNLVNHLIHSGQSTKLTLPHPALVEHGMWILDALEYHFQKVIELKQVNKTATVWNKHSDKMYIVRCTEAPRVFRSFLNIEPEYKKDLKEISCTMIDHYESVKKMFGEGKCEVYNCDEFSKSIQPLSVKVDFVLNDENSGSKPSELSVFGRKRFHKLLNSGTPMKVKLTKKYDDGTWAADIILGELYLKDFWKEDQNDQPKLCKDIRLKQGNVSVVRENTETKQNSLNVFEEAKSNSKENVVPSSTRNSESEATLEGIKAMLEEPCLSETTGIEPCLNIVGQLVGEVLKTACDQVKQADDLVTSEPGVKKDIENNVVGQSLISDKVSSQSSSQNVTISTRPKDNLNKLLNQPNARVVMPTSQTPQTVIQNICFEKNVQNINPSIRHEQSLSIERSFDSHNSSWNSGSSYSGYGDQVNEGNMWNERARRKLRYCTLILYGETSIEYYNSFVIGEPPPLAKKNMADSMRHQKLKWAQVPVPFLEQLLRSEMQRFVDLSEEFQEFQVPMNFYCLHVRLGNRVCDFIRWYPELEGILALIHKEIMEVNKQTILHFSPPKLQEKTLAPVTTTINSDFQTVILPTHSQNETTTNQPNVVARLDDKEVCVDQSHQQDKSHDSEKPQTDDLNSGKTQDETGNNNNLGFTALLKQLEISNMNPLSSTMSENGNTKRDTENFEKKLLRRSTSDNNLKKSMDIDYQQILLKPENNSSDNQKIKEEDWLEEEDNYPLTFFSSSGPNRRSHRSPTRTNFSSNSRKACFNCGKCDHLQSHCSLTRSNPRKRNSVPNYRRSSRNKNY